MFFSECLAVTAPLVASPPKCRVSVHTPEASASVCPPFGKLIYLKVGLEFNGEKTLYLNFLQRTNSKNRFKESKSEELPLAKTNRQKNGVFQELLLGFAKNKYMLSSK